MKNPSMLGNIELKIFFSEYWEKKPLLIKGAFKNAEAMAEVDDIKALSMDKDFESRLIIQGKDYASWQVEHGPFNDKKFKNLESKKWTLIAHNLNLLAPEFYNIQKEIQFLPDWIFDDVMATYSKADCTVGAHIDNYNVFIFQGFGKRKWQLQLDPKKDFIEGIDVKILEEFKADIEWELEPGDMIYIPPHVAHYGVSLTESISYSIGLKSLDHERMLNDYFTWKMSQIEDDGFIKLNFDESISKDPFRVNPETISKVKNFLKEEAFKEGEFELWFSNFLTTPREEIKGGETISPKDLREHLQDGNPVLKDQYMRFVSIDLGEEVLFNVNQREFKLTYEDAEYFTKLLNQEVFSPLQINEEDLNEERMFTLLCMLETGALYLGFDEDEEEEDDFED